MVTNPTPEEIMAARKAANLSQTEAAQLIYVTLRAWQYYEGGQRDMPIAFWELFNIKIDKLTS